MVDARAQRLAARAPRLQAETEIENLQRTFGFYVDHGHWQEAAALFGSAGTMEMGLQGVYRSRARIEQFLALQGPYGGEDGWLNDRIQLQIVVTVIEDGRTAKSRSRELAMTGEYERRGEWSEGIYENTYAKIDGVWQYQSMRYYPTFFASYEGGWTGDAQPLPGASESVPPDAPPTEIYEIFPAAHIPPYQYGNPVTGDAPVYPAEAGRPGQAALRAAAAPVPHPDGRTRRSDREPGTLADAVAESSRLVARFKDYHESENLESAYGYYLDKNLFNDLADIFSENSSMELAQRGVYSGPGRVWGFLLNVFGRGGDGPVEGQLGNHIQLQPVIHVAADGQSAQIRSRMLQRMSRGDRASWGANYTDGWARNAKGFVPGPSADYPPDAPPSFEFQMWPTVYYIPFHYTHPVAH